MFQFLPHHANEQVEKSHLHTDLSVFNWLTRPIRVPGSLFMRRAHLLTHFQMNRDLCN